MKVILLIPSSLILLAMKLHGQHKHGTDLNTTDSLQKQFDYHLQILDSAAKKSKKDTIYCCMASANFLERYTDIETGTMGNIFGRWGFTKNALKEWHKWYFKTHKRRKKENL